MACARGRRAWWAGSTPLNQWSASEIAAAVTTGQGHLGSRDAELVLRALRRARPTSRPDQFRSRSRRRRGARVRSPSGARPARRRAVRAQGHHHTADYPTEWGTPTHRGRRPGRDAACVALTRKSGRRAARQDGDDRVRQPAFRPDLQPARSRAHAGRLPHGSAAAVADHMVPIALGTAQTTGSTIRPAWFCGVFRLSSDLWRASAARRHGGVSARSIRSAWGGGGGTTSRCVATCYTASRRRRSPRPGPAPRARSLSAADLGRGRADHAGAGRGGGQPPARACGDVRDGKPPAEFAGLNDAHRWISSFESALCTFTTEIVHRWNDISETLRNLKVADGLSCSFERYTEMKALADACRRRIDRGLGPTTTSC